MNICTVRVSTRENGPDRSEMVVRLRGEMDDDVVYEWTSEIHPEFDDLAMARARSNVEVMKEHLLQIIAGALAKY